MSEALAGTAMLEDGGTPARQGDPCVLVIFGASGDLTRRLLVPSLYNLAYDKLLPENFAVVGVARNASTHEAFRLSREPGPTDHAHALSDPGEAAGGCPTCAAC